MGTKHVRFLCHHCRHCCTDVVCLPTPWDVIRLAKATGADPHDFVEFLTSDEITGVDAKDPTWLNCSREGRDERRMMALRRGSDGSASPGCHFLDQATGHCLAYEARPILCRLYPFKLHETRAGAFRAFSLHKDVGCPRHRDGLVPTGPLYDLYLDDGEHQRDYEDLVQVFNRWPAANRHPARFLTLFIEHR